MSFEETGYILLVISQVSLLSPHIPSIVTPRGLDLSRTRAKAKRKCTCLSAGVMVVALDIGSVLQIGSNPGWQKAPVPEEEPCLAFRQGRIGRDRTAPSEYQIRIVSEESAC